MLRLREQARAPEKPATSAGAFDVATRALAAVVGGYLLATVLPIPLVAPWGMEPVDAVLAAMALTFPVFTASVMWAFAARSARAACTGLGAALALAALAAWAVT